MRIFFLLITFTLFCAQSSAYQFQRYRPENMHLNQEQFRRFVKPQIQNIIQEYYFILKKLNPILGDLINIKQTILGLNLDWQSWEKKCQVVSYECSLELREFYKKSRALDKQILVIQKDKLNFILAQNEGELDAMIYMGQALGELAISNYLILHLVEEFLITSNTTYFKSVKNSSKFMPLLHEMLLASEMMMTAQLDKAYKREFEFVWNEFIRPAERYVIIENDKDFLSTRLEDFNMAWNSFHMQTVMSGLEVPQFAQRLVNLMHNRWNSVLKVILGNYKDK